MSLRRGAIAVCGLFAVGCAEAPNAPAAKDTLTAAEPVATAVAPAPVEVATPEPLPAHPVAPLADVTVERPEELPVAPSPEPALPSVAPAAMPPEALELEVAAPATPANEASEPEPSLAASFVAASTAETLDFSSLVTRLRHTKAINLRTKLAVRNESEELLEQARVYHTRTGETTLADLRRSYDSLLQELHALLEDADPPLAHDIDRSRAAIWEMLADPRKFGAI